MSGTAAVADPRLAAMADGLEETNWAAEVCDAEWRLVYASSQLRAILGAENEAAAGVGQHVLESRQLPVWGRITNAQSRRAWAEANLPLMIEHTPGGREALLEMAEPGLRPFIERMEPRKTPVWSWLIDTRESEVPVGQVRCFGVRARTLEGGPMATIYLYGSNLPATLLALVTQGNRELFDRMARLVEPGRREAAVMFADLQASGVLARRLPTSTYFRLIRELTTRMDDAIIRRGGIVGKHAGDGLTAFFVVHDIGSPSATAAAAIEASRALLGAARETADEMDLDPDDVRLNVGLHWGGLLYMGQVVTGGRLEVTALGDEVNEAARIQQAARDGTVLASKVLVEHLEPDDARRVAVDPEATTYRALAEIDPSSEKVVRDAGTLSVTALEL
jgi:class 3 adenylate cyclase